jgi:hypothetical protein
MRIAIEHKLVFVAALGLLTTAGVGCGAKDVDLGHGPLQTQSAGITYSGGCTAASCANQAAACANGETVSLQCAPDPNAGVGSDPIGACVLNAVCTTGPIRYTGGCTAASCAHQAAATADCANGDIVTMQCSPDPSAGQGSDPPGSCLLEAVCSPPDAG